jgi:voltage-gated sodium channel
MSNGGAMNESKAASSENQAEVGSLKSESSQPRKLGSSMSMKKSSTSIIDDLLVDAAKKEVRYAYAAEDQSAFHKFVRSDYFQGIVGVVIFLNAICIGIETDRELANQSSLESGFWGAQEIVFNSLFLIELVCKVVVLKWQFFERKELHWNLFDAILVAAGCIDCFILSRLSGSGDANNVSFLTTLRTIRLLRLGRLVRLVKILRSLHLFIQGLAQAANTVFWGMLLVAVLLYICGIFMTKTLRPLRDENGIIEGEERANWDNVGRSMLTLFQIMTLDGWASEVADPVIEKWPVTAFFFVGFICLTTYAILNVLVAVVVEHTLNTARDSNSAQLRKAEDELKGNVQRIAHIFGRMDDDRNQMLTRDEFLKGCNDKEVLVALHALEVKFNDVESLFDVLDVDESGVISTVEFVQGCLRARGIAKAKDLLSVECQMLRLRSEQDRNMEAMSNRVDQLHATFEDLAKSVMMLKKGRAGAKALVQESWQQNSQGSPSLGSLASPRRSPRLCSPRLGSPRLVNSGKQESNGVLTTETCNLNKLPEEEASNMLEELMSPSLRSG